jgi:hypothetical protein
VVVALVVFGLGTYCFRAVSKAGDEGEGKSAEVAPAAAQPEAMKESAEEAEATAISDRELVGQCAHNRSDGRLLGRVTKVGAKDVTSTGSPAPGERVLTVRLTAELRQALGDKTMDVTYPRNAIVTDCQ